MIRAVRDTELWAIPSLRHQRDRLPGMNHRCRRLHRPEKFDPERFAEPRNEHKKHRYAFTPFGGGAHKCIGMVFGQLEMKTVMHRLLRSTESSWPGPGYSPLGLRRHARTLDGMPIVLRPLRQASREQTEKSPTRRGFGPFRRRAGSRTRSRPATPTASGLRETHRPFGVAAVGSADEGRDLRRGGQLVKGGHLDRDAALVEHRGQSCDRTRRLADAVLIRSPIARVAW